MSRLATGLFVVVLSFSASCSERVDVLEAKPSATPDAAVDAGSSVTLGCDVCATLELCAIDRCVDAAGTTFLGCGLRHVCAIEGGELWCWGDNGSEQLGLGDSVDHTTPTQVGTFDDWLYVTGGQQHTCAIRAPGTLYCWGENSVGQLGLDDTSTRPKPTRVPGFSDFAHVACGGDNCCAVRASGALYCWGDNLFGNPGQRDPDGSADIIEPSVVSRGKKFSSVSVGPSHSCAIGKDAALYCWGRNTDGQLGISTTEAERREPTRVGTASDWRSVAVGQHHTCGVRGAGELYCWGRNDFLELGIGSGALDDQTLYATPVRVGRDDDWSAVALGGFHTCALKRNGALFCFGRGTEGQLGLGTMGMPNMHDKVGDPISVPTEVAPKLRFHSMALGSFHTCALDTDRTLHCWGANTEGQLGTGDVRPRNVPTPID